MRVNLLTFLIEPWWHSICCLSEHTDCTREEVQNGPETRTSVWGSRVSALYSEEEMTAQALKGVEAYEAIRDVVEDPFAQLGILLGIAHDVETSGLLSRRQIAAFVAWAIGADLNDGEPMATPIPPEIAVRIAPLMTDTRLAIPR